MKNQQKIKQTYFVSSKTQDAKHKAIKFEDDIWNDDDADLTIPEFEEGMRFDSNGQPPSTAVSKNHINNTYAGRRQTINVA